MRIPVFCSAVTALALLVFTNFPAAGQTPVLNEFAKLLASDGQVEDRFGSAIDLDGDIAVIGAPDDDAHADNIGSAYIFTRDSSGTWAESAKLVPSDGTWGDSFGGTVAVDGDVVVIGARLHDALGDNSGAVYVFTRDSADGTSQAIFAFTVIIILASSNQIQSFLHFRGKRRINIGWTMFFQQSTNHKGG